MLQQRKKLELEVQELHSHIQVLHLHLHLHLNLHLHLHLHLHLQDAERGEREKRESLVAGLEEGVREREVGRRRDFAAQQEELVAARREEVRQENLLARQLAGCRVGGQEEQGDFRRRKVRWFY